MSSADFMELLRLINGFQISQAIHVAATVGVADHLRDGPRTSEELASLTGTDAGALYRLLRVLAAVGVFEEHDQRRFSLTPLGDCLRSDSETPAGPWASFIGRPYYWQSWGHLLHSVRTGENAFQDLNGETVWQYRQQHPEEGGIFDRAMAGNSRGAVEALIHAYDFSPFGHVADIGGGHGQTLAGILAAHPATRATLFDQLHVISKAQATLEKENLADRCHFIAGSFFDAVPAGADAYILRMIIHDWEDQEAIAILKNCRRAMAANAKLLLIEQVVGPPGEGAIIKFSDLNMMVSPGGRERTRDEFADLCAQSGFALTRIIPAGPRMSVVEAIPR